MIRSTASALMLSAAALLGGCAGMYNVATDVSSFGDWPQARTPGTYAFERLPSQQAQPAETELVEASARQALDRAGFKPVAAGAEPDVLVQVGARDGRASVQPWDDPLWWRGGFGFWRGGPWLGPRWGGVGMHYEFPRYERQVALLIRDRSSGRPLYETRASSEGNTRTDAPLLNAMFAAALMDFPRLGVNPRRVVVPVVTATAGTAVTAAAQAPQ